MLTVEQLRQENPELEIFGYESVETRLQAAALILSYFESERERKSFLNQPVLIRNQDHSSYALHNSGRTIGQVAGLFQYKEELAWDAFDMIMQSIKDPKELSLEDVSYLLAVAFPLVKGKGTSAMANAFLGFAESIMDSGKIAAIDPVKVDMRSIPMNANYVQYTCLWLADYLGNPDVLEDEKFVGRSVHLAQRFLKYCPNDDNSALFILDRNANDAQIMAVAPDIQAAWLNSAIKTAGFAFLEDGVTIAPQWEFIREKFEDPKNKDECVAAFLRAKDGVVNEQFPRIYPGGGLVPAVEYKPSAMA